jgi:thioredoxin reductase (NADPH)
MEKPSSQIKSVSTEILIIGSGPAGLTAGLYASRAGREAVILEGNAASRLSIGYQVENYPGFISIGSTELLDKFKEHARHFGAEIMTGDAIDFNLTADPKFVTTRDSLIKARAVILATGRSLSRKDMIPGEEKLLGMGVSYCATCDGPLYRSHRVAVVGNSDEAAEDTLALNQMGCEVYWIPGSLEELEVTEKLMEEIEKKKIPVYRKALVKEIVGDQRVEKVVVEKEDAREELEVYGVFIFRGAPTVSLFEKAGIKLDHKECVRVDRFQRTSVDGVFAAGDVTCGGLQVISAAGEGCVAALQAIRYLREKGNKK